MYKVFEDNRFIYYPISKSPTEGELKFANRLKEIGVANWVKKYNSYRFLNDRNYIFLVRAAWCKYNPEHPIEIIYSEPPAIDYYLQREDPNNGLIQSVDNAQKNPTEPVPEDNSKIELANMLTKIVGAATNTLANNVIELQNTIRNTNSDISNMKSYNNGLYDRLTQNLATKLQENITEIKNELYRSRRVEIVVKDSDSERVYDVGRQHYKFDLLFRTFKALKPGHRNIMLVGPAGSGKTTSCEKIASMMDLPFYFINAVQSEYALSGFTKPDGQVTKPPFRQWVENGGVFLNDEADASSPAAWLYANTATSNGMANFPDGALKLHKDCYMILSANTYGAGANSQYSGRNKIDGASTNRFLFIDWDYDSDFESYLANNDEWVKVVQLTRNAVQESSGTQGMIISPRQSLFGAELLEAGMHSRKEIAELVFGNYMKLPSWQHIGKHVVEWINDY